LFNCFCEKVAIIFKPLTYVCNFETNAKTKVPGLPDGFFSNQKSQLGKILEVHAMDDVGTFYDHLVYFTTFGYILWPFDILSRFGMLYQEKSGNPAKGQNFGPSGHPVCGPSFLFMTAKICAGYSNSLLVFNTVSKTEFIPTQNRVARWFVFKPKVSIWVNLGGP
jgi:hypothetical protein